MQICISKCKANMTEKNYCNFLYKKLYFSRGKDRFIILFRMALHKIYYYYENYNIYYDNHTIQDVRSSWVEMVFMEAWQQALEKKEFLEGFFFFFFFFI